MVLLALVFWAVNIMTSSTWPLMDKYAQGPTGNLHKDNQLISALHIITCVGLQLYLIRVSKHVSSATLCILFVCYASATLSCTAKAFVSSSNLG